MQRPRGTGSHALLKPEGGHRGIVLGDWDRAAILRDMYCCNCKYLGVWSLNCCPFCGVDMCSHGR